jgi:Protein of unknown function (DUF3048) N-terminal domain/Protein of unknown function (DUF3048) C-terminal domain
MPPVPPTYPLPWPAVPEHAKSKSSGRAPIDRKKATIFAGVGIVILLIAIIVVVTSGGGKSPTASKGNGATTPVLASNLCPLTGAPAPGGAVPQRPALMVKVGNEPEGARPQSGLNEADVVFDTPAEGFIMRYIAVFQCASAPSIGPSRSVRWVDYHLARMFVNPILAFAGGINPNVDTVMHDSWIHPANLLAGASSAGTRITSRVAPDNLYTSTSALYGLYPKATTPPPPIFSYGSSLPSTAATTNSAQIDFSYGTDVTWKWDATSGSWTHGYTNSGTDVDNSTSKPVTTTNVVVMEVAYKMGPYIESTGGSGDVESNTLGEGPGYVLRDGKRVAVTWHRKDLLAGLTFTDASGAPVTLAPGRTWVEIVPNSTANAKGAITFAA